jgi:hypothetical protein
LKQVRKNDIFSLVIIIKSLFASQKSVTKKEKKKSTKGIIPIHTIMDMNYGVRTYLANTVFIYRFIYLQQIIQFSLLRPFLTAAENKKQFNFFRLFLALQLSFLKNNRELFSAKTVSAENKQLFSRHILISGKKFFLSFCLIICFQTSSSHLT